MLGDLRMISSMGRGLIPIGMGKYIRVTLKRV